MRNRRGHSLVEVMVAITLLSVLATIAVTLFRAATSETAESLSQRVLESAAAVQESYRVNRGSFAFTSQEFDELSAGEATFVTGASISQDYVSVFRYSDGSLGLATLVEDGKCAVLLVPLAGESSLPRLIAVDGETLCTGELAQ